jgi:hypothetical protein
MKSIEKQVWLTHLEEQVDQHLQEAIRFQNMPEAQLSKFSPSGGWSISQCLSHLNSYGQYYLPRLKTSLESQREAPASTSFTPSWLGAYLTRITDPKTSTKKFKAVAQHQPADTMPTQQVVAEFIDQQEELLRLLRKAGRVNVNAGRISVSIVPLLRLSIGEVLQFMVAHNERHIQQAKRLLAEP